MGEVKHDLFKIINELMAEARSAVNLIQKLGGGSKYSEPAFTLTWGNDGRFYGELYSYCLDLNDGGRHHDFEADDLRGVVDILQKWVRLARFENQETYAQIQSS